MTLQMSNMFSKGDKVLVQLMRDDEMFVQLYGVLKYVQNDDHEHYGVKIGNNIIEVDMNDLSSCFEDDKAKVKCVHNYIDQGETYKYLKCSKCGSSISKCCVCKNHFCNICKDKCVNINNFIVDEELLKRRVNNYED